MSFKQQQIVGALLIALGGATLTACGGGGSSSTGPSTITLSGIVTDGPIPGAIVCLHDSVTSTPLTANGQPICSSPTNEQGAYTLPIPANAVADDTIIALVATKDSERIKLVSHLGTWGNLKNRDTNGNGTIEASEAPAITVTHVTTAEFVLRDNNHDGKIDAAEQDTQVDASARENLAMMIQGVIDNGKTLTASNTFDLVKFQSLAAEAITVEELTGNKVISNPNPQILKAYLSGATFTRHDSIGTTIIRFRPDGKFDFWIDDKYATPREYRYGRYEWHIDQNGKLQIAGFQEDITVAKIYIDQNAVDFHFTEDGEEKYEIFDLVFPFKASDIVGKTFIDDGATVSFNQNGTGTITDPQENLQNASFTWTINEEGTLVVQTGDIRFELLLEWRANGGVLYAAIRTYKNGQFAEAGRASLAPVQ